MPCCPIGACPAVGEPAAPDRRATKNPLTGSLIADVVVPPAPPTRLKRVPDGDAEGAHGEPPTAKRRPAAPRAPRTARATPKPAVTAVVGDALRPAAADVPDAVALTAEGDARLRAELDELTRVKRPQIIARIRTAKEHGDLKENAEYHAAREEQSFLEGRVQAIEARLRSAVIVDAPAAGSRVVSARW